MTLIPAQIRRLLMEWLEFDDGKLAIKVFRYWKSELFSQIRYYVQEESFMIIFFKKNIMLK